MLNDDVLSALRYLGNQNINSGYSKRLKPCHTGFIYSYSDLVHISCKIFWVAAFSPFLFPPYMIKLPDVPNRIG